MPVPSTMSDLSVTEASNSPSGSDAISTGLDNYLRAIQAIVRSTNHKGADIASAASVAIGASPGEFVTVTGTTTITSFDSVSAGIVRAVHFSGALTLTHSSNIQLPGSVNYVTSAGDVLIFRSLGSGQWKCVAPSLSNEASQSDVYSLTDSAKAVTTRRLRGAFYAMAIEADATPQFLTRTDNASSWSVSWVSTGQYLVTHNLGMSTPNNLILDVQPMHPGVGVSISASAENATANAISVILRNQSGTLTDVNFFLKINRIGA